MARNRPFVFLGSSKEGLNVAKAVQANLESSAECVIWSQGTFGLGEGNLESLVKALDTFDFAILALTPDDLAKVREEEVVVPRDNVLLELGLFIGGLGRDRTFMLVDRTAKLKLPSDLAGITPATYQTPDHGTMQSAVGAACTQIEEAILRLGPKSDQIHLRAMSYSSTPFDGFVFKITNHGKAVFPPYTIWLLYSDRDGFGGFCESDKNGPLLPAQNRIHKWKVFDNDKRELVNIPLCRFDEKGEFLFPDDGDYTLQLRLEDSEMVLFENRRIARGVFKLLREACANRKFGGSPEDWRELDSTLPDYSVD